MANPKLPALWRRQAYQVEPNEGAADPGRDRRYFVALTGGSLDFPVKKGWEIVINVSSSVAKNDFGQTNPISQIDIFANGMLVHSRLASNLAQAVAMAELIGRELPNAWIVAGTNEESIPEFNLTSGDTLLASPAPEREWYVPGLLPKGEVTLLSGDGGTGKSLAALHLAVAGVADCRWFGHDVAQGPAIVMSAEDDEEEIHRRLGAICSKSGISQDVLSALKVNAKVGEDAMLGVLNPDNRMIEPTGLYLALERAIAKTKPALVVLDTLADLFGGDENVRGQARQFIGLLRKLTTICDTTILCLAHPSVAGIQSGTGTSGSTGWSNSVRSRLYLERVFEHRGKGDRRQLVEPDPDARILSTKKANYGRVGDAVRLRWADGVLEVDQSLLATSKASTDPAASAAAEEAATRADDKFLELLATFKSEGRNVSDAGPAYAPTRFAKDERAEGFTKTSLAAAMGRLFARKQIRMVSFGPASKPRKRIEAVA